jgi:hypothetical protein
MFCSMMQAFKDPLLCSNTFDIYCKCLADITESVTNIFGKWIFNFLFESITFFSKVPKETIISTSYSRKCNATYDYIVYLETFLQRFKQFKQGYKSGRQSPGFPEMPFMLTLNVPLEIKIIYCIVNLQNW